MISAPTFIHELEMAQRRRRIVAIRKERLSILMESSRLRNFDKMWPEHSFALKAKELQNQKQGEVEIPCY